MRRICHGLWHVAQWVVNIDKTKLQATSQFYQQMDGPLGGTDRPHGAWGLAAGSVG